MCMQSWGVIVGWLLTGVVASPGDAAKEELRKLEGTWVLVTLDQDGMTVPEDQVKNADLRLIIHGDKVTFKGSMEEVSGTILIDPTKVPKMIDSTGGPDNGKRRIVLGIYELENAKLKICADEKERPKEFKSKKGGCVVMVFKREKP